MKYYPKILILDDEEALRLIIAQHLSRKGYETFQAGTGDEGLSCLKDTLIDVVLLDLKLSDSNGLDLLPKIKQLQPDIQIVILTGHGTIESAIEAMKLGAFDYLTKPCNLSELEITLQKAIEHCKLLKDNKGLKQVVNRQNPEFKIIAEDPQTCSLLEITKKFAQSDAPVLIQGESGVGKELFARTIHLWSSRANSPYIPLNAGAIPEALLESELFGHEKGAYTGAGASKIGLVEMAHNGTLFLDEIGEMPLSLQMKVLRFLETGEFRRVGDNRLRQVDVRIVSATNRNLEEEVKLGHFRQDLYYRLNGLFLKVPPLRERPEDIIPLAEYFLKDHKDSLSTQDWFLAPETKAELSRYNFPGNVRELFYMIKRGQILADEGIIKPGDIWPDKTKQQLESCPAAAVTEESGELSSNGDCPTLREVEKHYILAVLKSTEGNRTQAANILGISTRNLYRKIQSYEVE